MLVFFLILTVWLTNYVVVAEMNPNSKIAYYITIAVVCLAIIAIKLLNAA